jgi:tetratricopeptide (TPR) repeat protein
VIRPSERTCMLDSHASVLPSMSVDVLASTSGDVTVRWTLAPGHHPRAIPAEERARIDALAEAVRAAESLRPCDSSAIARTRHELGRALSAVLDGPERALTRRCQDAAGRDGAPALAIRLGSIDKNDPVDLARHPAMHWRWELIADERGPLAAPPGGMAVAVQLGDRATAAPRTFELGGLRILFMAFSPNDTQLELDYEREEEHVLSAVSEFVHDGRARLRVVEQGSLDELKRCLLGRTYDIVHLSGHGVLTPEGPRLLMEDEVGDRHPVSPDELLHVLRRAAHMPEVVMLSSCFSAGSRDGMPSLAAQLVAGGVPTVIGWVQPVRDDLATEAAADIYQRLCTGATPAEAVAFARRHLFDADQSATTLAQRSHTWGTLHLLTRDASDIRLDQAQPALADEPADVNETYTYLDEGRMRVLARGFIGRRRPLQRLIRILVHGEDQGVRCAGAVILGMKGVGKSCLAGRAIQRVSQELDDPGQLGLVVVNGALDELGLLEQFHAQGLRWDDKKAEIILNDTSEPLLRRLRRLLAHHWKRRRLVIVLDDFEQNLDTRPEGHALLKPAAAALLEVLVPACRTAQTRLLVTTTASFELNERDQASLPVIRLGPFEPSSIRKIWLRGQNDGNGGPGFPGTGSPGTLAGFSSTTWNALCDRLGRNPRILDWARTLIAGKSHGDIDAIAHTAGEQFDEWVAGAVPSEEEQNELARLFLRHLAYDQAVATVSADARTFIKRVRVYETAVPARALEAFTEGLDVNLDVHLPALQNLGLLEAGELEGTAAYRVSPLVEPALDIGDAVRWHRAAAKFWEAESQRSSQFDRVQMAWEHALAGRCEEVATQMGRVIDVALHSAGLYHENQSLALRHFKAFPDTIMGLIWVGSSMAEAGDPRRGWTFLEKATERARSQGATGRDLGEVLTESAIILQSLGRSDEARERLEEAIELEEANGTDKNNWLARALHEMGRVLRAQSDLQGAQKCLERALLINKNIFGSEENLHISASLHELSGVLREKGDLDGARLHLERVLAVKAKVLESDEHPALAASLHALGLVLRAQGDLDGARVRLEQAYKILIAAFGTEAHPSVATSLHALAGVLQDQGDLGGARAHLEQALAMTVKLFATEEHPDVASSLCTLGVVLREQGDLQGARGCLERSLAISRAVYATEEHFAVAQTLHALGVVMRDQGDLDGARASLESSLGISRKLLGAERHFAVAASLHALAGVLQAQGDLVAARTYFERTLEISRKLFGTEVHPLVVAALHGLAGVLQAQGDIAAARTHLERVLEISTKLFGTGVHPLVAAALHGLAGVRQAQGDLVAARSLLERTYGISIKLFGTEEHPDVAASFHALAGVLQEQGDLDGAGACLERSLAIKAELFGTEEHPDVAASLHALAGVRELKGDLDGARTCLERSLRITIKTVGTEEHPDVAASLHALAGVLQLQGDTDNARKCLERSISIQIQVFGTEEHPDVAASLHNLGGVLQAQGELGSALQLLERSLSIQIRIFGTDEHLSVAALLHSLARVLRAQGNLDKARVYLEKSLAIKYKIYGTETHRDIAASLHELASVLTEQHDLQGARAFLERALAIFSEVFGTDEHYDVAASLHELAGVLQSQGNLSGARVILERSLAISRSVFGTEDHPDIAASLHELARVHYAQGDRAAAIALTRRVLDIQKRCFGTLDHCQSAETEFNLALYLLNENVVEEAVSLLWHSANVFAAQAPEHPRLTQILRVFNRINDRTPNQVMLLNLSLLSNLALVARGQPASGTNARDLLDHGLTSLATLGPPWDIVAAFLGTVADGSMLPSIPVDLPEDVARFLTMFRDTAHAR